MKQHSLYYEICNYLDNVIKYGNTNKKELQYHMICCGYNHAYNTDDMIDKRLSKDSNIIELHLDSEQDSYTRHEGVA